MTDSLLERQRAARKRYRLNNPDKDRAARKRYRLNNPDKKADEQRRYRERYPEKKKQLDVIFRKNHRRRLAEKQLLRYRDHPTCKELRKKYLNENPKIVAKWMLRQETNYAITIPPALIEVRAIMIEIRKELKK